MSNLQGRQMRKLFIFHILLLLIFVSISCAGKPPETPTPTPAPPAKGKLKIYVTDALPQTVSAIQVKLKKVEVHKAEEEGKWIEVLKNPEPFDLIKIAGMTLLLGTSELEPGRYTQVRVEVESVKVTFDEKTFLAQVPSAKVKLVGTFLIEKDKTTEIALDFDAQKSLLFTGAKEIIFKPVIKLLVAKPGEQVSIPKPRPSPSAFIPSY